MNKNAPSGSEFPRAMNRPFRSVTGFTRGFAILIAALVFSVPYSPTALAGDFAVSPIRLEFDQRTKTGAITVGNESDKEPLTVQMKAFTWTQDAEGKDVYEETKDVLFFPRIATIDPRSNRVIRAGFELPREAHEKTYRLFIEEVPPPRKDAQGAMISVTVRFGVPIFVKPASEPELRGEISSVRVANGMVHATVKNTGNVHFMLTDTGIESGNQADKKSGWYLLAGASREHSFKIPEPACSSGRAKLWFKSEKIDLQRDVEITPAQCKAK